MLRVFCNWLLEISKDEYCTVSLKNLPYCSQDCPHEQKLFLFSVYTVWTSLSFHAPLRRVCRYFLTSCSMYYGLLLHPTKPCLLSRLKARSFSFSSQGKCSRSSLFWLSPLQFCPKLDTVVSGWHHIPLLCQLHSTAWCHQQACWALTWCECHWWRY